MFYSSGRSREDTSVPRSYTVLPLLYLYGLDVDEREKIRDIKEIDRNL